MKAPKDMTEASAILETLRAQGCTRFKLSWFADGSPESMEGELAPPQVDNPRSDEPNMAEREERYRFGAAPRLVKRPTR